MHLKCIGFFDSKNTSLSKKQYLTVIEELCHQFSLKDLRKSTNNFDEALKLGEGGFGPVYKGCLDHNGATSCTIALKRLRKGSKQGFTEFMKEIELLCQLRHPNIVTLIGFCNHNDEKILVYEHMPNGSLHDYLSNKDIEPLSWKKRLEICIGAAHGLRYLHSGAKRTIFHRDIKPSNILLDNNMVPKLADFGISLLGPLSTSKPKPIDADNIAGTFGYLAPEYAMCGVITDKCDVYSFGMVLLQMVCTMDNQMIINKANMLANQQWGENGSEYLKEFSSNRFQLWNMVTFVKQFPVEEFIDPILPGKIAPECWQVFLYVIKGCLNYEPNERLIMGEVEVLLEYALSLQEEADIKKTDGDYIFSSITYINQKPVICIDVNGIEELLCHEFSLADLKQTTYNFWEIKGLVKLNGPTCPIPIAVKKIDWPSICRNGKQWDLKKEIEKICQLRHPNLASLLGFCDHHDKKILVYMYISYGPLSYHLSRNKDVLTWKKRLEICIGVSQGLDYLHTATIFHRNMKLNNILLDDDIVPKLINFGFPWSNPIHAEGYAAPEWSQGHDFTDKCDVYSFGLVLLLMIFKYQLPINKKNIYPALKGKVAPRCWEVFQDITRQCLKFEANDRPTINEVKTQLQHALALQEEADDNTNGDYNLLSTTFDAHIKAAFARITPSSFI